jgi:hypothetical protein
VLVEAVTHFGSRAVFVFGEALNNQSHSISGVALIDEFIELNTLAAFAGSFFNRPVDIVSGHVHGPGLRQQRSQGDVGRGIAATQAGRHRDFFGNFTESFPPFGVNGSFFVFDVRPFTMSSHDSEVSCWLLVDRYSSEVGGGLCFFRRGFLFGCWPLRLCIGIAHQPFPSPRS